MDHPHTSAESIFGDAAAIQDPQQRAGFVRDICAGDAKLRAEVESLLGALDQADGFMDPPHSPVCPAVCHDSEVGRRVGRYEVLEEVARGGMGVIYKAHDPTLNRVVALKMILGGYPANPAELERFRSEAEVAASLSHPNIVGIYEVGAIDGRPFYSMPFLEGASLGQLVESGRWERADGRGAACLLLKVARAVQHVHEHGILHRDLKPGNIFLDARGEPQVMDFGLAKRFRPKPGLTLTGEVLGSPSFMAPEQAAGRSKEVTVATDVYGLGAVLYYLLTGRPPFVAESPLAAMLLALEGQAAKPRTLNPSIPVDLERICLRCLEKSPDKRYASAADLAADLERCLTGEPLHFPEPGLRDRIWAWMHTYPGMSLRLTGLAVSALVSEISFQLHTASMNHSASDMVQIPQQAHLHYAVIATMVLWSLGSWGCHLGMRQPAWEERIRFAWATLDVLSLTAILALDRAVESGLIALYSALIAFSGSWLRVPIVALTTALIAWCYVLLMLLYGPSNLTDPPHWPFIVLVVFCLEGFCVAYLVHRMGQLSQNRDRSWLT